MSGRRALIALMAGLALGAPSAQAAAPYVAGSIVPYTDPAGGELSAYGETATGAIVAFAYGAQGTWTSSAVTAPGAVAGLAVPDVDPLNHELLALAPSPGGDFLELARNGQGAWTTFDITSLFHLSQVAGTVLPYTDPGNGELLAFAQAPNGDFVQFERISAGGAWKVYDMTAFFSLGQVTGSVVPYTDPGNGELLAFAQAPNGDFVQFERMTGGGWKVFDITSLFSLSKVAGTVIPYTDPQTHELLAFARSPSGDFVQFRRTLTGEWKAYDLTSYASLGTVAGSVVPYTDPATGQLVAFARSPSGDLLEFSRNASTFVWTGTDITTQFGVGSVSGTVVPYTDPASHDLLVFATDPGGDALEFSRGSQGTWSAELVPTPPPVQPVAVSQPLPVPTKRGHGRAIRARFVLNWTWNHMHTRLRTVRARGLPRRARIEVRCRGRGCPNAVEAARYRGIRGMARSLDGRIFRAGDVMTITVTAPGRRRERIALRIRNGKEPKARLL